MKRLWISLVGLIGWKYDIPAKGERPELERCVIIVVPHTSIDDFFLGAACLWKLGINFRIFIKKEFFNFFTRPVMRWTGAIPVDRGNRTNGLVAQAIHHFETNEHFALTICPEGTRKAVKHWKRGFYEIAMGAKVPIVLSYIDYKTRHMGVGPTFYPTGDYAADMIKIMDYYKDSHPRHPEGYNAVCEFANKEHKQTQQHNI